MIEEQIYDAAVIDVNRAIMMFAVLSCGTFLIPVRAKPPQHCIVIVQVVCQTRFAASHLSSEEERSLSKRFARMWALRCPNTRGYATRDTGHVRQSCCICEFVGFSAIEQTYGLARFHIGGWLRNGDCPSCGCCDDSAESPSRDSRYCLPTEAAKRAGGAAVQGTNARVQLADSFVASCTWEQKQWRRQPLRC
jgi:hypothetical protein